MSQDDDSGKKRPNPWGTTSGNQNNKKGKDTPWGISSSRPHGSGNRGGSGGGPEDFGDILQWLLPVIGLTAAIASGGKEFIFLLQWFYSTGGQAVSSTLLKRIFNYTSLGIRPNG